ncbi:Branched-chain amino acids ABC transporter; periplasmic substrate-binding component [uncultured Alphaproteobacteria bacterium]|uniref:Branched-chain amino acids ABC transporter periplasmic substrate-binding component n=1 Tax=uncultured Alphaproteobacteria bacterium TaxID=91750 RepID=A0A212KI72_9PROT|nr:Branched-chain amino acids ABC transporter; periplasmic substrate-binding component [uncultured Alphaproteobacteria bacterium]
MRPEFQSLKTFALAAAALACGYAAVPAQAADPLLLGYQMPLSGDRSQYGEMFRNAAEIQLKAFNAAGGVNGVPVEIVYEDSKNDPKEAIAIARKFADNPRILGVLGDFSSTVSMAAGEVYAKAGVPQLSQTASHPDYTKTSKWQFRNITTQAYEGPFVARWMQGAGIKSVAIVAIQNDWGISAAEEFAKAFKEQGGKVTATEYFNPGTRDFRSILTKIGRQKPDAVYLCMFYEEGASALQQAKQLGLPSAMFSTSSLYSPKLVELGGDAVNGVRMASTFVPENPAPEVQHFVEAYATNYGNAPNMFAAQAYDATGIMLAALKAAGPQATRAQLRDALADTRAYPGVTGATSFDPATREPAKELAKMVVENGKFKVIE